MISTETLLSGAIGTLTLVIGVLWAMHMSAHKTLSKNLADCEKDRKKLWAELLRIERVASGDK